MTAEQTLAMILGRCTVAMIRAKGMEAENRQRELNGLSLAYDEEAFERLIDECNLRHYTMHGVIEP